MPVAAVNGSETPACRLATHEPPQARTMISAGFSGSCAKALPVQPVATSPPSAAAPPRNRRRDRARIDFVRSEEHTSELQSRENLVCRLLLEKKKKDRRTERY